MQQLTILVITSHVAIAMSGQVFEGLAFDNILHFNLNVVYVRAHSQHPTSRLIGSSLALYMIGISISPFVASLLGNFRDNFIVASGCFWLHCCIFLLAYAFSLKQSMPTKTMAIPSPERILRRSLHHLE
jgi:hypothetical protein